MRGIKKSLLSVFIIALFVFLAACGNNEAANSSGSGSEAGVQELTIKLAHEVAENTSQHEGSLAFKEAIEKASGGKIKVQVYPNGQLFGDKDVFQNIVANNVQFTQIDMAKLVGDDPRFNIPSLPFLFKGDDEAVKFWDSEMGMEILSSLEKDGLYGLSMWPNGPKHLTNGTRPIKSPEDLKGIKFRTQGGQVLEEVFSTVGAGSVSMPFTELYTALQQGTVDGQTNTFVNIESKKFDEVQKYLTITGESRVDLGFFANKEFMDGLNDETRKIIDEGIKAGTERAREAAKEMNAEALKKLEERGQIEITELSDDELQAFKDAWAPVYDEFTDVIGEEYIEAAKKANE
ncbi:DctP family TRAP transporter solute-binding subunit [Bacillus sp. ISL-47]|uniref:TRAP transporter substrate-binding protein n=1 Tax=Bacillus sp. ISL-47 TaxID=2819130 RepID=UPI001BE72D25|nr:DctP family TRAP transporter solute-binding subunit [Bacillus sp. ISL-47]MBT2689256.1 DctP family TRAP transporter solute-binding subunit [Bacillus sp. ISL-47]MBT2708619.1 DctP family TRAP transporter solute-binding subunit [Pseudomonas sp. ISL-84]